MTEDDLQAALAEANTFLRENYPDPEQRFIAAHRIYKHETVTPEDYWRIRRAHEASLERWRRVERIGKER